MAFGIDPAAETLRIARGVTYTTTVTVKNDGTPIDLTGATAAALKANASGTARTVIDLSLGSGLTLGGPAGTVTILISAAATALLDPADFPARYSLSITYADTTSDMILDGVAALTAGTLA